MAHSYQTTRGCSSLALWWGDHHQGAGIRLHSTAVATCEVVFTERIKYERPSSAAGSTTGKVATFRPAESPKRVAPVPQLLIEWPITCSQQPEQQQDTAEIHLASSNFHPSPSGRLLTPDPPSKKKSIRFSFCCRNLGLRRGKIVQFDYYGLALPGRIQSPATRSRNKLPTRLRPDGCGVTSLITAEMNLKIISTKRPSTCIPPRIKRRTMGTTWWLFLSANRPNSNVSLQSSSHCDYRTRGAQKMEKVSPVSGQFSSARRGQKKNSLESLIFSCWLLYRWGGAKTQADAAGCRPPSAES